MTATKRGPRRTDRGDLIAKQYQRGATMRELAERHGVSKAAVSVMIKRRGASPTFEEQCRRATEGRRAARARERKTKGKK